MATKKKPDGQGMPVPDVLVNNFELMKRAETLFNAINHAWNQLEEKIVSSGVLKPTYIYCDSDGYGLIDVLGITKVQGKWRIVYATENQCEALQQEEYYHKWIPITDCNIETRKVLLPFAPELVRKIFDSNSEVVQDLAKAVNESERFLRSIGIVHAQEGL
jgi:hypothetical protein